MSIEDALRVHGHDTVKTVAAGGTLHFVPVAVSGLEELLERLVAAADSGDRAAVLDAALDMVSWSVGIPPLSTRLREILDQPGA